MFSMTNPRRLPLELMVRILKLLDKENLLKARQISQHWEKAANLVYNDTYPFPIDLTLIPPTITQLAYVAEQLEWRQLTKFTNGVFICEDSHVFYHGDSAMGTEEDDCSGWRVRKLPLETFGNRKIIDIKCAPVQSSFIALCEDGSVFSWGSNVTGHLGQGDVEKCKVPTQINPAYFGNRKIIGIRYKHFYAVFLAEDGTVFSCGSNDSGELGQGNTEKYRVPTQINPEYFGDRKIVDAIVDYSHTIFRCDDDSIFSCGWNDNGQLGLGHTEDVYIPQQISPKFFEGRTIINIAIGNSHTVFHCDDGILTCGSNYAGQIGQGETEHFCLVPTPLPLTNFQGISPETLVTLKITQVSAGSLSTIIDCEDDNIFICGLGTTEENTRKHYFFPTRLAPKKFGGQTTELVHANTLPYHNDAIYGVRNGGPEPYQGFSQASIYRKEFLKCLSFLENHPELKKVIDNSLAPPVHFSWALPRKLLEVTQAVQETFDIDKKELPIPKTIEPPFTAAFDAAQKALERLDEECKQVLIKLRKKDSR